MLFSTSQLINKADELRLTITSNTLIAGTNYLTFKLSGLNTNYHLIALQEQHNGAEFIPLNFTWSNIYLFLSTANCETVNISSTYPACFYRLQDFTVL